MELYNLKKDKVEEVKLIPFKLEGDIQTLVEKNTEVIFQLETIQSEFTVKNYRIDTLCLDIENNSFVIIEYKRGKSDSVIDQGMTYLQLLLNNKDNFILKLSQYYNKVLTLKDIDWTQSKVIFVAESYSSYQKDSVNFKNLPFELWEIKKFSNNTVVFNRHKSDSKESIETFTDPKKQSALSIINKEIKVYNEEDVISKTDKNILDKWNKLKEYMSELSGTELTPKRNYISLMLNNKTVAYFNFFKQKMRVDFARGNVNQDGSKSKNYFNLDDPKKISYERSWTWKGGTKGTVYKVPILKDTDTDYLIFLIKQKYNNLRQ